MIEHHLHKAQIPVAIEDHRTQVWECERGFKQTLTSIRTLRAREGTDFPPIDP